MVHSCISSVFFVVAITPLPYWRIMQQEGGIDAIGYDVFFLYSIHDPMAQVPRFALTRCNGHRPHSCSDAQYALDIERRTSPIFLYCCIGAKVGNRGEREQFKYILKKEPSVLEWRSLGILNDGIQSEEPK